MTIEDLTPLEDLTTDNDVARTLYNVFCRTAARRMCYDIDAFASWEHKKGNPLASWLAVGAATRHALSVARVQSRQQASRKSLARVISWLTHMRNEARYANDPFAEAVINKLLRDAQESYRTGAPLPTSDLRDLSAVDGVDTGGGVESIGDAIVDDALNYAHVLLDAQRDCCQPASEWCRRPTLEAAIAHANYRASRCDLRQYVYRSRAHETINQFTGVIEQFWLITNWRPGYGYAGLLNPKSGTTRSRRLLHCEAECSRHPAHMWDGQPVAPHNDPDQRPYCDRRVGQTNNRCVRRARHSGDCR